MAAESAFFGLAFVNIGLMPDGGSTAFVPPAVGRARAFQMALLGERVPSAQALEWGLVNWVHPDDRAARPGDSWFERLAAGPTRSYAASKRALNRSSMATSTPSSSSRPSSSTSSGGPRLPRGHRRVRRETRPRLHRPLDPAAISDLGDAGHRARRPAHRPAPVNSPIDRFLVKRGEFAMWDNVNSPRSAVEASNGELTCPRSAPARRARRPGPSPPRGSASC